MESRISRNCHEWHFNFIADVPLGHSGFMSDCKYVRSAGVISSAVGLELKKYLKRKIPPTTRIITNKIVERPELFFIY